MSDKQDFSLKKSQKEILNDVLTKLIRRMKYRKWLDLDVNNETEMDKFLQKVIKTNSKDNNIFTVALSNDLAKNEAYDPNVEKGDEFDGKNVLILYSEQIITGKSQLINDFVEKYPNNHKIVVVKKINDKTRSQINENKFTEVLWETDVLLNVGEHILAPQCSLLTPKETDEVLAKWMTKLSQLPKQTENDGMTTYLYGKSGQVVKCISHNSTTALGVYYRAISGMYKKK